MANTKAELTRARETLTTAVGSFSETLKGAGFEEKGDKGLLHRLKTTTESASSAEDKAAGVLGVAGARLGKAKTKSERQKTEVERLATDNAEKDARISELERQLAALRGELDDIKKGGGTASAVEVPETVKANFGKDIGDIDDFLNKY